MCHGSELLRMRPRFARANMNMLGALLYSTEDEEAMALYSHDKEIRMNCGWALLPYTPGVH